MKGCRTSPAKCQKPAFGDACRYGSEEVIIEMQYTSKHRLLGTKGSLSGKIPETLRADYYTTPGQIFFVRGLRM